MAEYVRSVTVSITVDTNKRTIEKTIEADSIEDAVRKIRQSDYLIGGDPEVFVP